MSQLNPTPPLQSTPATTASRTSRAMIRGIAVALFVLSFAVFWPVHQNDFTNYDDDAYITENVHVLNGLSWAGVKWAFTTIHTGYPHPLTWLTHQLDYQLYGLWAGGHHLTSVFFHTGNAVLLFLLFWRMTGALWQSAFVAAVFAIHPLHVESVAWVAERKDVLFGLFWILTLHAYVRYAAQPQRVRYALVLLLFALGFLTKPMIVTLPCVLLLLDIWPLRRVDFTLQSGRIWLSLFLEKIPLFALTALFSVVTIVAQHRYSAIKSTLELPWPTRLANGLVAYVEYITHTVWPAELAAFYPFRFNIPLWQTAAAAAVLLGITIFVFWHAKRHAYALVGWLWFVGTLVPVIGLIKVGDWAMADRYMYIPLVGLSVMIAWSVPQVMPLWRRRFVAAVALVALIACVFVTRKQIGYWRDSVSLYERALSVSPRNAPPVFDGLADALMREGRLAEADEVVTRSLCQFPEHPRRLNLAALIKLRRNEMTEAERLLKRGLELDPNDFQIHNHLGIFYAGQNQWTLSRPHFEHLIQLRPYDVIALANLAQVCLAMRDYSGARRYCERGETLAPRDPLWRELGAKIAQAEQAGL